MLVVKLKHRVIRVVLYILKCGAHLFYLAPVRGYPFFKPLHLHRVRLHRVKPHARAYKAYKGSIVAPQRFHAKLLKLAVVAPFVLKPALHHSKLAQPLFRAFESRPFSVGSFYVAANVPFCPSWRRHEHAVFYHVPVRISHFLFSLPCYKRLFCLCQ